MSLIGLFVLLIVFSLMFWAARTLMATFAVPAQIQVVVQVLIVVLVCLWLLEVLGLLTGLPYVRVRP